MAHSGLQTKTINPIVYTLEYHQDDPAKCTSAKMRRLGLARSIPKRKIRASSIVLDPFARSTLLASDAADALSFGLVVVDCSWEKASHEFRRVHLRGSKRKLPALLAGNPTNYSKLYRLSSLEAAAASLYIMGYDDSARKLLGIYKWGETFLSLNGSALEEYSQAKTELDVQKIQRDYFPHAFQSSEVSLMES